MSKAQLILAFILASTLLAGMMASVASRAEAFGNRYIYIKANPAESICTSTLYFRTLAQQVPGQLGWTTTYATTIPGPCPNLAVVYTGP